MMPLSTAPKVAPLAWDLTNLLKAGNVVGARRVELLQLAQVDLSGVTRAYVSWRLKAASQPRLVLPGVWAASQLLTYHGVGAGDFHDTYAAFGPIVLAYLLHWARVLHTTDKYVLYQVADAARQDRLGRQLTKFWGLYRRLWPVDFGLATLTEQVAALGIDLDILRVRIDATGAFYLTQPDGSTRGLRPLAVSSAVLDSQLGLVGGGI